MDSRTAILAMCGALILGLVHALDKNVPAFAELSDKWRALLASALGIASGVVDAMVNGTPLLQSVVTVFAVSGPSFVVLLVTMVANAVSGNGGGTGAIDLQKDAKRPLPPLNPPALMVGLSCLAVSFAITVGVMCGGCAVVKPGCAIIKIADEACQVFAVTLPDGSVEKVPAADIQKLALRKQQVRLGIRKVEAGGE